MSAESTPLGRLLEHLAEVLPPLTAEEEARMDARRARREARQKAAELGGGAGV